MTAMSNAIVLTGIAATAMAFYLQNVHHRVDSEFSKENIIDAVNVEELRETHKKLSPFAQPLWS